MVVFQQDNSFTGSLQNNRVMFRVDLTGGHMRESPELEGTGRDGFTVEGDCVLIGDGIGAVVLPQPGTQKQCDNLSAHKPFMEQWGPDLLPST